MPITTGWTVVLNANQLVSPGGVVTFATAPKSGSGDIKIISQPVISQQVVFEAGVPWNAAAVASQNSANDRAVIVAQSLRRDITRSMLVPVGANAPVMDLTGMADGQVLGQSGGKIVPLDNSAAAASVSASVSAANATIATGQAAISTANAVATAIQAGNAAIYGPQAVSASLAAGVYPAAYP